MRRACFNPSCSLLPHNHMCMPVVAYTAMQHNDPHQLGQGEKGVHVKKGNRTAAVAAMRVGKRGTVRSLLRGVRCTAAA